MGIKFGTRTAWVADVIADVKRLVVTAGFPPDCVYEFMNAPDSLLEAATNDKYCAIFPGRFGGNTGGGNDGSPADWNMTDGMLSIEICSRITKDALRRSVAELSDASRGFSALTLKVAKAVHRETLADSSNNSYLHEPMRVTEVSFNQKQNTLGWNKATVVLSVKFRADLS